MKYFITGGAGFIGSNMADRLLSEPENEVVVYDNFSTGRKEFLEDALKNPRFTLVVGDTLDLEAMTKAMEGCEFVFHFAANADVRMGCEHPSKDLQQNTIATFNVLEAKKLSERFRDSNKNIPWIDIYGLRNKIVHDYGSVRLDVVFSTAKEDVPTIYKQLF